MIEYFAEPRHRATSARSAERSNASLYLRSGLRLGETIRGFKRVR